MSQPSGYIGVTVDGSNCTDVSIDSSIISCTLPAETGVLRPVIVTSGGSKSTPASSLSYAAPKIVKLEGGEGCVIDDSVANVTGVDTGVCIGDSTSGGVVAAAIKMCNRTGSEVVPLTIIGDNFGASDVAVTVTFQGAVMNVTKDDADPHRKLSMYLPPGTGSGSRLPLAAIVSLQIGAAFVSYEPCPLGQDAECVDCAVGKSVYK